MLVRKHNFRANSKAGRVGNHAQGPSPLASPVSMSGAYTQPSKTSPDRLVHGMAQGAVGSLRSIGKGVKGSVGSRQGVVPSIFRPVEPPQHLTQSIRVVHQSPLPSFEFGSGNSS